MHVFYAHMGLKGCILFTYCLDELLELKKLEIWMLEIAFVEHAN